VELHLLQESQKNEENLAQLLHLSHSLKHKGETFQGFDWFVATVFVLCGGNMERCVLTTNHKPMFYMYIVHLPTS